MKRLAGAALLLGLAALFALNSLWIAKNAQSLGGTRSGQAAPDFSLPLLDGGQVRLGDGRGSTQVLVFWATWCGPCVGELPDVQRLADQEKGVRFLAINVDGGPAGDVSPGVRAFRQRLGLRLPIALDDGSASQSYRVDTIPRTVIVDKEGRVARVLDGAHSFDDLRRALTF
jgi:thiol-disulfide isomerase/thioredoxin